MWQIVFFEENTTQIIGFLICLFLKLSLVPYGLRVITRTMLFLQLILYSSSFADLLKNDIRGAALEICQLKLKQFSPDILKFSIKHKDNPFTLNWFMAPRTCLFIFDSGSRRLGSNNFQNSSYKEKQLVRPCFQAIFPFLMTMDQVTPFLKLRPLMFTGLKRQETRVMENCAFF